MNALHPSRWISIALVLGLLAGLAARADENSQQRNSTTSYPWNTVCCVKIGEYGRGRGSAVLVGPYVALTAGHVVYSAAKEEWHTIYSIAPGQYATESDVVQPYGTKTPCRLATNTGHQETGDTKYDYGALFISSSFSITTYMPLVFEYDPSYVNCAGYPSEDCNFEDRYDYSEMWYDSGDVTDVDSRVLYYDFFLGGGASGCPVWVYSSSKGRRLVGINVAHNGDGEGIACRLVSQNEDLIEEWLDWAPSRTATSLAAVPAEDLLVRRSLVGGGTLPAKDLLSKSALGLVDAPSSFVASATPSRKVFQVIENTLYVWKEYEVALSAKKKGTIVELVRPLSRVLSSSEARVLLSASQKLVGRSLGTDAAVRLPAEDEIPIPAEDLDANVSKRPAANADSIAERSIASDD
ncbi:MAG: hypothetical protein HY720_24880 [Planctomycetes bacterium]|nr:hypothetical protein [Planctomycetota bacterium]